jgi:hypothetical protein
MVKFGVTPYEALVTATRASGEYLGQPLGVIRSGAHADLVLIDGDPLTRIEDVAAVRGVVRAGEALTMDEILGPFGGAGAHAAPATAPRRFVCEAAPQYWWHDPAWLAAARASCCDGGCPASLTV